MAAPAEPVSAEAFAALIAPLGPFERNPAVAVAVSGGADSMALTLLLADWVRARGGGLTAITVDHGLRPEAAAEARQVAAFLAGRPNIDHHILEWRGRKPETGIQAAARGARYRLLTDFCRDNAILHLCLGHHRDDQWETHAMRAGRGSAEHGLAGMNAVLALRGVRILRPLLSVPKAALSALLTAREQPWIEDPSNRNEAFARVRLRRRDPRLESEPATRGVLGRMGALRDEAERAAAGILANSLTVLPFGGATLAGGPFRAATPAALLALGWVLQSIGGTEYPAAAARRRAALASFRIPGWPAFTLGGCHIRERDGRIWICRDWGAVRDWRGIRPGESLAWDRRFAVSVDPRLPADHDYLIGRLGECGTQWLGKNGHSLAGHPVPEPARKSLPALWRDDRPVAVPQLGYGSGLEARFCPAQPATSCGFTVAY